MNLSDKNIIITGSSSGIGFELLNQVSMHGGNVIACCRKFDEDLKKKIDLIKEKYSNKIYLIKLDLSSEESTIKAANEINGLKIQIDGLVNNAGIILNSLFEMTKLSDLKNVFQVNFFSQFIFTQTVVKSLKKNKNGSSIVNIASTSAFDKVIGRSVYSSSKAALISLSNSLSNELSRYNIRVNSISPGMTNTEMLINYTNDKVIEETKQRILLKRAADKEEITNLILFLLSKKSSYINGQNIRIDGGMF